MGSDSIKWHPRNKHQGHYDFEKLSKLNPSLKSLLKSNPRGQITIDFSNPEAVKSLNATLLESYYDLEEWALPPNYLCPAIPGRAEYIHLVADLLNTDEFKSKKNITCLDIGTGASLIYPIIAAFEYEWLIIGVEIDELAFEFATKNRDSNDFLKSQISLRQQSDPKSIFSNVILDFDEIDVVICNPPFHRSESEFLKASKRKHKNLHGTKAFKLNFGGHSKELWCEGGELGFIERMIKESVDFKYQIKWFTSLVSRDKHMGVINKMLESVNVAKSLTLPMKFGNKQSRIIAWRF